MWPLNRHCCPLLGFAHSQQSKSSYIGIDVQGRVKKGASSGGIRHLLLQFASLHHNSSGLCNNSLQKPLGHRVIMSTLASVGKIECFQAVVNHQLHSDLLWDSNIGLTVTQPMRLSFFSIFTAFHSLFTPFSLIIIGENKRGVGRVVKVMQGLESPLKFLNWLKRLRAVRAARVWGGPRGPEEGWKG